MYIYARYLSKQLFWTTVFLTITLTGAVWLTQSLRYIDFVIARGLSIFTFIKLISYLLPNLFATILPISLLIATLFVLNKLYSDNELIVLRSLGISDRQLITPPLVITFIVSITLYIMNLYVHPLATQHYKELKSEIRNSLTKMMIQPGDFNTFKRMTFFAKKRSPGGELQGIFIYDLRDPKKPVSMTAEKGIILDKDQGIHFILFQGTRQSTDQKTNRPSILTFDQYSIEIRNPPDLYERDRKPGEFFIEELLYPQNDISSKLRHRLTVEAHQRLLFPLIVFPFVLMACIAYLYGDYNRRGRAKRVALTILHCILLEVFLLLLLNLSNKSVVLIYLAYGTIIISILTLLYFLLKVQKSKDS
jgi:lipopolysaccharide export system permease protein